MNESQGIQTSSVPTPFTANARRVPPQKPNKPVGLGTTDTLAASKNDATRPVSPTLSDALAAPGGVVTPTPSVRGRPEEAGALDAEATEPLTLKEKTIGWLFKASILATRVRNWAQTPAGETAIFGACTAVVAVSSIAMLAVCSGATLIAPAVGLAAAVVLGVATFLSFRTMQNAKASVAA